MVALDQPAHRRETHPIPGIKKTRYGFEARVPSRRHGYRYLGHFAFYRDARVAVLRIREKLRIPFVGGPWHGKLPSEVGLL